MHLLFLEIDYAIEESHLRNFVFLLTNWIDSYICYSYPLLAKACLSALHLLSKPRWVAPKWLKKAWAPLLLRGMFLFLEKCSWNISRAADYLMPFLSLGFDISIKFFVLCCNGGIFPWLAIQNRKCVGEVRLESSCGPLWSCCQNSFFSCHFTSVVVDYLSE